MKHGFEITDQLYSREIALGADQVRSVFKVTLEEDTPWTIGYQEIGVGSGTGKIIYTRNLVQLEQKFSFGKFGGDFITGIGPFELEFTGGAATGSTVKAFWTKQPFTIDVGEETAESIIPSAATTDLGPYDGFIPFPYNRVSIFSEEPTFLVALVDQTITTIFLNLTSITQPNTYILDWRVPPNARVRVRQNSGANKIITAVYSRG